MVLKIADEPGITVHFSDGTQQHIQGNTLDEENSRHIFLRDGRVKELIVSFASSLAGKHHPPPDLIQPKPIFQCSTDLVYNGHSRHLMRNAVCLNS